MSTDPKIPFQLLAVDDSPGTLEVLQRNLERTGYAVRTCTSVQEALDILQGIPVDLVITDYKMPRHSGIDLIKHVRENHADTAIIMITGFASIDGAVEAIKEGAEDYLAKPFTDTELLTAVKQVLEKLVLRRNVAPQSEPARSHGIVGNSAAMQQVFKWIAKAADMNANVLISGESGTGKELVARAIHYGGPRSMAPFVPVNCTAIPESLLESELFGHVKGAFTGAKNSREGFFQIAEGGTIFLDEIGDASLSLQGKLLRVIQNKEIFMVGSSRVRKVNARIITATHKDLPALVKKGLFREDLFYRLNVIDIHIPALRERREDVPPLLSYFTAMFATEMDREPPTFSDRALNALMNYPWPGNIRELENLIQRLLVTVDGDMINIGDLPDTMRFCINREEPTGQTLADVEARHIQTVLKLTANNKTRAADILGIDRKTLRTKLKKIGIRD